MALRVGIIGCGTAGQAAGVLLSRAGHRVTVLERAPRIGPVGAGLLIQPTGMAVLEELGVLAKVMAAGTKIRYLKGETDRGRVILDLAYEDLRPGLFGLGVHRGTLFTILQEAVDAAGVEVRCGCEVVSLREVDGDARVVADSSVGEHGPFDVVVVADGAKSALRDRCVRVRRAREYPWGAMWFVGEDAAGVYGETLAQVYRGTGRMIGFLPSGIGPRGTRTVSVFWSVRCEQRRAGAKSGGRLEAWKAEVRALTDKAEPILEQVVADEQLIFAAYQDVVVQRCHEGPVVCIGDAAHAMSPQLGQGANLALMDASALAQCLAGEEIRAALARFSGMRLRNVRFYQFASRWLTPLFQSGWEWASPVRDRFMGPMCRVGWCRREMLRSLVGVKTGILGSGPIPGPMVQ